MDVNEGSVSGLVIAARKGRDDLVRGLLENGVDVYGGDCKGLLEAGVLGRNEEVVRLLMRSGVCVWGKKGGGGLLVKAIQGGCRGIMRMLVEGGVDIDEGDDVGDIAMNVGVVYGGFEVVKYLLEMGGGVDMRDCFGDGKTALMVAVEEGSVEVVKLLMRFGADVRKKNGRGRNVVDLAMERRDPEILKWVQFQWEKVELPIVVGRRDAEFVECMKRFLKEERWKEVAGLIMEYKGKVVGVCVEGARNVLHVAAAVGRQGIVMMALSYGAALESKDRYGWTPTYIAARNGHFDLVKQLVVRGEIGGAGAIGQWRKLLHCAIEHNDERVVKYVCSCKKEVVEARDELKRTALWIAAWCSTVDVVRCLLNEGRANANIQAEDGGTPLLLACQRGDIAIVKLLLQHRAATELSDSFDRRTPLSVAIENYRAPIIEMLVEHSAEPAREIDKAIIRYNLQHDPRMIQYLASLKDKIDVNRRLILEEKFGYDLRATVAAYMRGDLHLCVATIIGAVRMNEFDTVEKLFLAHSLVLAGVRAGFFSNYRQKGIANERFFFYKELYHRAYFTLRDQNLAPHDQRIVDDILVSAREYELIDSAESIVGTYIVAHDLNKRIDQMGAMFHEAYDDIRKAHDHVQGRLGRLDEFANVMGEALMDLSEVCDTARKEVRSIRKDQKRTNLQLGFRMSQAEKRTDRLQHQFKMDQKARKIASLGKLMLTAIPFFGHFLSEVIGQGTEQALLIWFTEMFKFGGEEIVDATIDVNGNPRKPSNAGDLAVDLTNLKTLKFVLSDDFASQVAPSKKKEFGRAKAILKHTVEENFGPLKDLRLEIDRVLDVTKPGSNSSSDMDFERLISNVSAKNEPKPQISESRQEMRQAQQQSSTDTDLGTNSSIENVIKEKDPAEKDDTSADILEAALKKRFESLKDSQVAAMLVRYCCECCDDEIVKRERREKIEKGARDYALSGRSLMIKRKSEEEVARGLLGIPADRPDQESGIFDMVVEFVRGFRNQEEYILELMV